MNSIGVDNLIDTADLPIRICVLVPKTTTNKKQEKKLLLLSLMFKFNREFIRIYRVFVGLIFEECFFRGRQYKMGGQLHLNVPALVAVAVKRQYRIENALSPPAAMIRLTMMTMRRCQLVLLLP